MTGPVCIWRELSRGKYRRGFLMVRRAGVVLESTRDFLLNCIAPLPVLVVASPLVVKPPRMACVVAPAIRADTGYIRFIK